MPSFSTTLEKAIHKSLALAAARKHELATLEHLLLALIEEPEASSVMEACSVDLVKLQTSLSKYLDEELSSLISTSKDFDSTPTTAFQRVIQRAAIHVQSSGRSEVTGANVLVAIFAERESNAAYFLQEQEMTRYDAVNFIAHGVAKIQPIVKKDRLLVQTNLKAKLKIKKKMLKHQKLHCKNIA